MADNSTDPPRDVDSFSVEGQQTNFLTPEQQAAEDARLARKDFTKRKRSIRNLFRFAKFRTKDAPP